MPKYKLIVFDWNGTLYDVNLAGHRQGQLYPGVAQVLAELKAEGYLLAIATAASRRSLLRQLVNFGIDSYFSAWSCGDESFGKPHPEVMHALLDTCGALPHETLMIGDTEADMLLAKNANTDALAVSYGLQPVSVLLQCGAQGAISDISELPHYLRRQSA